MKKIIDFLGGREFLQGLVFVAIAYIVIERIGVFRDVPALYREIFHSGPAKALAILVALNALSGIVRVILSRGLPHKSGSILFYLSLLVLVGALFASVAMRFEGKSIRPTPTISIPKDVKRAEAPIDPALAIFARFGELAE